MRLLLLPVFLLCYFLAPAQRVTERDFRKYFDEQGVEGSFLLFDAKANQYTAYNLPRCREGFLPASTFKIPNTLIGLETGALRDTSEICHWDGVQREIAAWNTDMPYAQALRVSCVPCYQQLARRIGAARYQTWLAKLKFGRMNVTAATVDTFWLTGTSRITQFEQIDFLRRFQSGKLPIAKRHQDAVKALLVLGKGPNWTLRGKTGWTGFWRAGKSNHNGWFVGWVEQNGQAYFFALNMEPKNGGPATQEFIQGRRAITEKILRQEFQLMQ
ncbi:class D beta-lactamase [Hymenobacter sp. BT491]|uniref:class D beta-lactamase n=1 Tax=Hymenobacter sp. BT491 TaxID=2766779 RepID=UPI001653E1DD|nr:class D beta-lactamase [Hymenobacter sp. BT491]MBC6988185.1 class D beta-lactamase [Hymenobacter sp. BT491]